MFTACGTSQPETESAAHKLFPPASEIQTYYREVNGEEILGALISPRLEDGNYIYQYAVNALLFCERGMSGDNVRFAPIGLDLNLPTRRELLGNAEATSGVNGLPIYAEFLPLYKRLGEGKRIGMPLSGLRYNPRQRRYEQYFEGVGMYRSESDPPGRVKLLAYGAWKCGEACLYPIPSQAEVVPPIPIDSRVLPLVEKVGVDFTGFALSPAIKGVDGTEMVIFENIVIEIRADKENGLKLAPLPQKLGILPEGMVSKQEDEKKVFLSLDGDKGHHVWRSFMAYMDAHGGLGLIGLPIGEPQEGEDGSVRQCFENACLIEDRQIEGVYRIRPSPLGFEYATLYLGAEAGAGNQADSQSAPQPQKATASPEQDQEVTLEIIEERPFVEQEQQQTVGIIVHFGDRPAKGLTPTLYLSFSDGQSFEFEMPPTNAQGKSYFTIPPTQVPNGTLVNYRICIAAPSGVDVCALDDYLIWSP
ncbi:MAG: hypothetical protein Kow0088_24570 [Anaerolineales bacterium]